MDVKVTFEGLEELIGLLKSAPNEFKSATRTTIDDVSTLLLYKSQARVPVDTGVLKSSGNVIRARVTGDVIEGGVGYGGAASKYAAIVHEMRDPNINWTTGGTGPGYLNDVANELLPDLSELFKRRLLQILKK